MRAQSPSQVNQAIPAVVSHLVKRISAFPGVQKVILYGSRAKGSHSAISDIDIAVTGVRDRREWTQLHRLADVEEHQLRTLLKIDLVQFEQVDPEVQKNITEEGLVLYERQ